MELQDDPRFIKGIEEFNNGLYFECHETLEEIWLEEHGEERKFYQGIIQIAAGYYKLEQGVPAGALKLWRMGMEKLQAYSPVYLGVNVDALVAASAPILPRWKKINSKPPALWVRRPFSYSVNPATS
jgi:predicted metal-dependent hydrolase